MLSNDHTPDKVQAFRPVLKSQKPSTTSASFTSNDLTFIDCHTDLGTYKVFILWMDIQEAFDGALLVTHKTKTLPFLKGPDYQTLEPCRIALVPVTSAPDQKEGDGGHPALTESQPTAGTTNAQKCDSPQENGHATPMDLMQTMIRASQGDADAQVALGDRYKKGNGVDRDRRAALDWYLTAAKQDHAHAQCNIGLLLCADNSVERTVYYEQYRDDSVHDNSDSDLDGEDDIPRDRNKGLEWLLKAAHQGLAGAQIAVAMVMHIDRCFDQGDIDPTELSTIIGWARKAADQKHEAAKRFVVDCCVGEALVVNLELVSLFKMEINRSGGCAECALGCFYMRGVGGVLQDDSTAFEWFFKGAEQGSDMAQYQVAKCYEYGRGVYANHAKAIEWYTKVSQKGHRQA
ncbi:MAG: hypothetical protein J3R72DRAFT_529177 [Linnemannia gamsii]|nr:MAG: hypothetical protein J3R72DRAFT_529177 [Linnemannia gamsii]